MQHERRLLRIEGGDRTKFLNDLITVNVPENGTLGYGALLTPQGKLITDLFVWTDDNAIVIDLPTSVYDAVLGRLRLYKLRADVDLNDDPRGVWQVKVDGMPDPRDALFGRHYGDAPDASMDSDLYRALRVGHLIPEFGVDFGSEEIFPIEWRFREMGGIDYQKGCYVGQEIAARMRYKTELNKTVMQFRIAGDAPLGTPITANERAVGTLLTQSGEIALGFVRLKALGGELRAGEAQLTPYTPD